MKKEKIEAENLNLDDSEDLDFETEESQKVDNPFIELRNLIDSRKINVKTILAENQLIRIHQLNRLIDVFNKNKELITEDIEESQERKANIKRCNELINGFTIDFMTLRINQDGVSRKQFIEALHKGSDKAEESKAQKLGNTILNI